MRISISGLAILLALLPGKVSAVPVGYAISIATAYALSNPFPNRIDRAFAKPDTGYLRMSNTGDTTFIGSVGTTAVTAFAGDMSFSASGIVLAPGDSISIAIPDDASDVGGFNGPAFQARPGVKIWLHGVVSTGSESEPVDLTIADADIHSGVIRKDPLGLMTDSFVLQGGDPWGFDPGDAFELSQAQGNFVFQQAAPEPAGIALFALPIAAPIARRRRR